VCLITIIAVSKPNWCYFNHSGRGKCHTRTACIWIGLDWFGVLRLINSFLFISSCPEKWGRYSVKLACVTCFFYVLCDSRHTSPRCILSSASVAFPHPKVEYLEGEYIDYTAYSKRDCVNLGYEDASGESNTQPTIPEANALPLSHPGARTHAWNDQQL
jgi:hypothetical protein